MTTTSCTVALLLALAWFKRLHGAHEVVIPKRTYVGVAMSVVNAGHDIAFRDEQWSGQYQLSPFPLFDAARRFTSGMHKPWHMEAVSFHWAKILGIEQGGALLLDDPQAEEWLRRARFDGRTEGVHPKEDTFDFLGWHAYMAPETAAKGLMRLSLLARHNADLPNSDYSDLSLAPVFRGRVKNAIAEAAE